MRSAELDAVNAAVDTPALPAVTAAPASRLWSVQVASFREVGKANVLRDRLRAEQFETYVREKLLSDGTLFTQVFVGPVPNRQVADRLNGLVMTKFSLQGLIVRYRE
ncbi:SPOR domain-containing protein [Reinekea sp.]|uniref:SPOR domain-containing protein n=1 Tax=Reinekea sp. TaxID=1970455 RepID=UPI002A814022|nr:SPOR domain-containing protein [Reinekea sp.]